MNKQNKQTTWWIIRKHNGRVQCKPLVLEWKEAFCDEIGLIIASHKPNESKLPMQIYYDVFSVVMN